jgi:2-C-methyl-D-erythritol 4-phosphate cytidylyltransferase
MTKRVALIVAAGAGTRMAHALPKQYLALNERPLLWYSISALCSHSAIDGVAVVLHPDDKWFAQYDWQAFAGRLHPEYCGGATRAQSVLLGLRQMRGRVSDDDWVLVHDAARPCLTRDLIDRLVQELEADEVGGLLAIPAADTLKREDGSRRSLRSESREHLWQAQTPQMFRYALLLRALESADLSGVTDEASAVEQLNLRPRLVAGSAENLKVTFAEDVELAALILRAQEKRASASGDAGE